MKFNQIVQRRERAVFCLPSLAHCKYLDLGFFEKRFVAICWWLNTYQVALTNFWIYFSSKRFELIRENETSASDRIWWWAINSKIHNCLLNNFIPGLLEFRSKVSFRFLWINGNKGIEVDRFFCPRRALFWIGNKSWRTTTLNTDSEISHSIQLTLTAAWIYKDLIA